ncbi:MAG: allophanate hydrolase [Casimicrobiaceae bacterium]
MTISNSVGSLDLFSLLSRLRQGSITPTQIIDALLSHIAQQGNDGVWIYRASDEELRQRARDLEARRAREAVTLPLFGVPFAVKDNFDVAGWPTTAGCPDYSYTPTRTATAVERLIAAGAILVGKTNLDQFAAGLVGTRSPYGISRNPFDPRHIPGGSSSGSAVAVAAGLVSFALGTDTAGSGRVPASFNNIVGVKPTRGVVSTFGVVPACRSLDCVSIFALNCTDARTVLRIMAGYDRNDPYSLPSVDAPTPQSFHLDELTVAVPRPEQLEFFGDKEAELCFAGAVDRMTVFGAKIISFDYNPFAEAARALYEGPWLAERLVAVEDLMRRNPKALHPVTRQVIGAAQSYTALDAFKAMYRLQALKSDVHQLWHEVDVLLLPTTGTGYAVEEVLDDPLRLNANLGYYTNFVNLLDLCAVAVPNAIKSNGLPCGVTLVGPALQDELLITVAGQFHKASNLKMGATNYPLPPTEDKKDLPTGKQGILVAVVGAHLSGEPLNDELVKLGATLVRRCRTCPEYRLYALQGVTPPKPGLVRMGSEAGSAIEAEVWSIPMENFGKFVATVPAPLCIGTVELHDGDRVKGFLCEQYALSDAKDISEYGGWRAFSRVGILAEMKVGNY